MSQLDEIHTRRARGVTEAQINRLPLHAYHVPSNQNESENEGDSVNSPPRQCAVCLAPFEEGENIRTVLCLHQFHQTCIDPWLRSHGNCPVCKFPAASE